MNIQKVFKNAPSLEVDSIMVDSREKTKNAIFFCIVGFNSDGHKYIENAVENGAICIVISAEPKERLKGITYIKVEDTKKALNDFACVFYDDISKNFKLFGVTGTNGKTTIAYNLNNMLSHFEKSGYIGTIGYIYDGETYDLYHTTPDILPLHQILDKMNHAGVKSVAMEVSSQGLDLHRVDALSFDCAIYTNLTQEHIDYHKTMENYYLAKRRLFELLPEDGVAIINIDDAYGPRLLKETNGKPVSFSIEQEADYQGLDIKEYADHTRFTLKAKGKSFSIDTNVVARFNISNLVACIAALSETGYDIEKVVELAANMPKVPGRCEIIDMGQPFTVLVDFAHTPDGLLKVLQYAKAITPNGRIITAFGTGGDRDKDKRPMMGEIADKYCDEIILTCDDNHFEPLKSILDGIASGIKNHTHVRFDDRYDAANYALRLAKPGDCVCILSKGDEQFYKVGADKVYYMGDDNACKKVLSEMKAEGKF